VGDVCSSHARPVLRGRAWNAVVPRFATYRVIEAVCVEFRHRKPTAGGGPESDLHLTFGTRSNSYDVRCLRRRSRRDDSFEHLPARTSSEDGRRPCSRREHTTRRTECPLDSTDYLRRTPIPPTRFLLDGDVAAVISSVKTCRHQDGVCRNFTRRCPSRELTSGWLPPCQDLTIGLDRCLGLTTSRGHQEPNDNPLRRGGFRHARCSEGWRLKPHGTYDRCRVTPAEDDDVHEEDRHSRLSPVSM